MSKAEERALERFPVHEGASEEWIEVHLKDICGDYIEGYHQAEKDLELSWEDIKKIYFLFKDVLNEWYGHKFSDEGICREVLKRFKAQKVDIVMDE